MRKRNSLSRRHFINLSALGAAGVIASSAFNKSLANTSNLNEENSKVIVVKDLKASIVEGTIKKYPVNQDVVQKMMETGIKKLTGIDDIGEAWKSLFPGISIDKVISIKLNCIGAGISNGLVSSPEVTYSAVNGLKSMKFNEKYFSEENIIIWDRSDEELKKAGYSLNKSASGLKCYGTNNKPLYTGSIEGYSAESYDVNGVKQFISKIITEQSDYLINISAAKQHMDSGVSVNLKNHYGSCSHPEKLHGNNCDPYISALYALDVIRKKEMLCICDAIYAIISGGPFSAPQAKTNSLILSKDPVAIDTVSVKLLMDNGMKETSKTRASYINAASKEPYKLGISDLNKIDLVKIDSVGAPLTSIKYYSQQLDSEKFRIFSNYPNPFKSTTEIIYQLYKPGEVIIEIFDMKGVLVKNLINQHQNEGYYRISWNGTNSKGITLPKGTYIAKYSINLLSHTVKIVKE